MLIPRAIAWRVASLMLPGWDCSQSTSRPGRVIGRWVDAGGVGFGHSVSVSIPWRVRYCPRIRSTVYALDRPNPSAARSRPSAVVVGMNTCRRVRSVMSS